MKINFKLAMFLSILGFIISLFIIILTFGGEFNSNALNIALQGVFWVSTIAFIAGLLMLAYLLIKTVLSKLINKRKGGVN